LHPRRLGIEWRVALIVSVLALAAVLLDLTPLLRGPAPYPPEWRWDLRAVPPGGGWLAVLAAAAVLVALAALPSGSSSSRASAALVAVVVAGFLFQLALVGLEPAGVTRTLMDRALSRTATSYLTVAASEGARDAGVYLDHHAERRAEARVGAKHAATHPPAPVLFYRALIAAFDRAPGAAAALLSMTGIDPAGGRRPASVRAAALAGPLVIMFLCVASAWPLAALARAGGLDAPRAVRVAALWPLLPGPALMAPHFDQMLAFPVTAAAALLMAACDGRARAAVAAGLLAGIALQVSYGAAVFLALAGAAAFSLTGGGERLRRYASPAGWAVVAAGLVILLPMAWGHEPVAAARSGLAIHRESYTAPRSYATWLLFNPIDLALFTGVPIAAVFTVRLLRIGHGPFDRMRATLVAGITLLLLSGTVRGELGRIGIPLMPLLLLAAVAPNGEPAGDPRPTGMETALGAILLAALTAAIGARWAVA
jgi:hypothetical protein